MMGPNDKQDEALQYDTAELNDPTAPQQDYGEPSEGEKEE
jgi:hypothetical protein